MGTRCLTSQIFEFRLGCAIDDLVFIFPCIIVVASIGGWLSMNICAGRPNEQAGRLCSPVGVSGSRCHRENCEMR